MMSQQHCKNVRVPLDDRLQPAAEATRNQYQETKAVVISVEGHLMTDYNQLPKQQGINATDEVVVLARERCNEAVERGSRTEYVVQVAKPIHSPVIKAAMKKAPVLQNPF
jgi:hypothetical protein